MPDPKNAIDVLSKVGGFEIERLSEKAYLGEESRSIGPSMIEEALVISFTASVFMALLGVGVKCPM